jgi:hypothetical protein
MQTQRKNARGQIIWTIVEEHLQACKGQKITSAFLARLLRPKINKTLKRAGLELYGSSPALAKFIQELRASPPK